jgi:UDP-N-acetyl-D-glucosamine dehydrogenase
MVTGTIIQSKNYYEILNNKIINKKATVGIIGLGYVGLPNAVSKARQGFNVIGFDVNEEKVFMANTGNSYIKDVSDKELIEIIERNKFYATTDFSKIKDVDVAIICVPTPIDEHKQPNLSYIEKSINMIALYIQKGSLVVLESTTYPSTTEDIIVKQLKLAGFKIGEDIFVAYSPERIDPSNKKFNIDNTPRLVGGITYRCTKLACELYGGLTVPVSSPKVAEMAKVFENTFRFVNIALVNELALICDKMGVDVWEVIESANTKPYGFMAFYPSAGIGGHCIPVDPHYLSWQSKKFNINARMIEVADEINTQMTDYLIKKVIEVLNKNGKSLKGSKVYILGASYKKDVGDVRESAVIRVYDELKKYEASIVVCDPHVKEFETKEERVIVEDIDYKKIEKSDIVILLTDHSDFDYEKISKYANIIIDTKNAFKNIKKANLFKL